MNGNRKLLNKHMKCKTKRSSQSLLIVHKMLLAVLFSSSTFCGLVAFPSVETVRSKFE